MRIDATFVSLLVIGLLFFCAGAAGVISGKHITRAKITSFGPEFVDRRESPVRFWFHVAVSIGCASFLLMLALIHVDMNERKH